MSWANFAKTALRDGKAVQVNSSATRSVDLGFPLVEGGKLIGAIGCSGGTGDQDAAACKVGADLVK
mgnify:CR=1 FL=1